LLHLDTLLFGSTSTVGWAVLARALSYNCSFFRLTALRSIFFLIIFTVALTMKAFFRMLAAGFGSEAPAQAVAGICLLALALYTGTHY
jgi:hypothetical protein